MENNSIEVVVLIGVTILFFTYIYAGVYNTKISVKTYAEIIGKRINEHQVQLLHLRGEQIKHYFLRINNQLVKEGYNFIIGQEIETAAIVNSTVTLTDENNQLLFFGTL